MVKHKKMAQERKTKVNVANKYGYCISLLFGPTFEVNLLYLSPPFSKNILARVNRSH